MFKLTIVGLNKGVPAYLNNHLFVVKHSKNSLVHKFILMVAPSSDVLNYLVVLVSAEMVKSFKLEIDNKTKWTRSSVR